MCSYPSCRESAEKYTEMELRNFTRDALTYSKKTGLPLANQENKISKLLNISNKRAKKIIDSIRREIIRDMSSEELKKVIKTYRFKIGDKVVTTKGGRFLGEGPFSGIVIGFGRWRDYETVIIKKNGRLKKSNARIVRCLLKNIIPYDKKDNKKKQ